MIMQSNMQYNRTALECMYISDIIEPPNNKAQLISHDLRAHVEVTFQCSMSN